MADPMNRDVTRTKVGMINSRVPAGHNEMVQVAVEGDEPGRAGCGFGEFVEQFRAWRQLADQRQRLSGAGQQRAGVRGAERDQRVHPPVTAEALNVVTGDQATEAVPNDMDAFVTGFGTEPIDSHCQVLCRCAYVAGEQPIVEPGEAAKAAAAEGV